MDKLNIVPCRGTWPSPAGTGGDYRGLLARSKLWLLLLLVAVIEAGLAVLHLVRGRLQTGLRSVLLQSVLALVLTIKRAA